MISSDHDALLAWRLWCPSITLTQKDILTMVTHMVLLWRVPLTVPSMK